MILIREITLLVLIIVTAIALGVTAFVWWLLK